MPAPDAIDDRAIDNRKPIQHNVEETVMPTAEPKSQEPSDTHPDRSWAPLALLDRVRAARSIRPFRTTVAMRGSLGIIVGVKYGSTGPVYTVRFTPAGLAGATVTFDHLTEQDITTTCPRPISEVFTSERITEAVIGAATT